MKRASRLALLCVASAIVLLASVGLAYADSEPANNRFTGAEGPLAKGVNRAGVLSTSVDVDWYYFYVPAIGDYTFTFDGGTASMLRLYRYDAAYLGDPLLTYSWGSSLPTVVRLDPGLHYVAISNVAGGSNQHYNFKVNGTTSATAPSTGATHRSATIMPEIYETMADDAKAQVVANYANNQGVYEAGGDVDLYKFYVTTACSVRIGHTGDVSMWVQAPSTAAGVSLWGQYGTTAWGQTRYLKAGKYFVWTEAGFFSGPGSEYVFSVQGKYVTARPWATLSVPVLSRTTPRRNISFVAKGTISPAHAAATGSKSTIVKFYRKVSGSYRYVTTKYATITALSSVASKYSVRVTLGAGAWRARVYHHDAGHLGNYSGYRYFTVK